MYFTKNCNRRSLCFSPSAWTVLQDFTLKHNLMRSHTHPDLKVKLGVTVGGSKIKRWLGPLTPVWSEIHTQNDDVWRSPPSSDPDQRENLSHSGSSHNSWVFGQDLTAYYSFPFCSFRWCWLICPRIYQYETLESYFNTQHYIIMLPSYCKFTKTYSMFQFVFSHSRWACLRFWEFWWDLKIYWIFLKIINR